MYEHVVLEKYRVDSAGTHLQIVIPDKDVSYYITDKKARCGELRIDDCLLYTSPSPRDS